VKGENGSGRGGSVRQRAARSGFLTAAKPVMGAPERPAAMEWK
jgi:hypothetical protein